MQKNLDNFFKGPKKVRDESKDNKLPKPSVEEKEAASQPPKPVEKSSQKAKRSSNSKEMIVEEPAAEKPEPKPPTPSVTKKLEYRTTEIKNIEFELYEPKKHAPFSKHQLAPFFFICECFDLVAEMKGANSVEKKKRVLINMVKTFELLNPSEAADFYLFATGRLDAEYLQEDLGVGNETMLKSCAHAAGSNRKTIKEEVDKVGDLGKVIEERKAKTQTVDSFFTKKVVDNKRVTVGASDPVPVRLQRDQQADQVHRAEGEGEHPQQPALRVHRPRGQGGHPVPAGGQLQDGLRQGHDPV